MSDVEIKPKLDFRGTPAAKEVFAARVAPSAELLVLDLLCGDIGTGMYTQQGRANSRRLRPAGRWGRAPGCARRGVLSSERPKLVTGATATGLAYVLNALNALCPMPSYALCPMSYATLDIGYWISNHIECNL
jgi:hypothetical protein